MIIDEIDHGKKKVVEVFTEENVRKEFSEYKQIHTSIKENQKVENRFLKFPDRLIDRFRYKFERGKEGIIKQYVRDEECSEKDLFTKEEKIKYWMEEMPAKFIPCLCDIYGRPDQAKIDRFIKRLEETALYTWLNKSTDGSDTDIICAEFSLPQHKLYASRSELTSCRNWLFVISGGDDQVITYNQALVGTFTGFCNTTSYEKNPNQYVINKDKIKKYIKQLYIKNR